MFAGGNTDNVKLEIKNEITTKTETIQIEVFNGSGKTITTGFTFDLEKKENGEWIKMEFSEDYKIKETAVIIRNLMSGSFRFNVVEAFGKTLDAGEYRITKSDLIEKYPNCFAVFTVKDV